VKRHPPTRSPERLVPDEGPILLWPKPPGEERRGLLLEVNVCPFPGCPERHVIVDGFLVENLRRTGGRPGRAGGGGGGPEEGVPEWAFVVSVDVDEPGEVHVEKCENAMALRWFREALDAELRAALQRRFERQRAEHDAVLGGCAASADASGPSATRGGDGWSAVPIAPPGGLDAVLAGFERGIRSRELRSAPPGRGPARAPRTGRNKPCPCGSGRKYKRCCLGSA